MTAKCLMIQGTGSGVGKSLLTAAFCRRFYLDGYKVAPFKAQNMSLNSFVTTEGGEMGRAQVYQAEACGIAPHVSMNPVLLKPCGDNLSQVIVMGQVIKNFNAKDYFSEKTSYRQEAKKALNFLMEQHDLIIMEGAGSPAEINLREFDFVNMQSARWANAPVLIISDIDRGGAFAWMKGTLDLLEPDDRRRVTGFIINKFRGDANLLKPGIRMFEEMTDKPIVGVVPFYRDLFVDEEDSIPSMHAPTPLNDAIDVAVPRLPRISNFTDMSPLVHDPNVSLRYVWKSGQLGRPDLIILPGSKNTLDDLDFLRKSGLANDILDCHKKGSILLGICAGFQMLGKVIRDPNQLESTLGNLPGLNIFNSETEITPQKITRQSQGFTSDSPVFTEGLKFCGYEIHMGSTLINHPYPSLFKKNYKTVSSAISLEDGTAIGTYLHGFFDNNGLRKAFLDHIRKLRKLSPSNNEFDYKAFREKQLDRLAVLIDDNIDMDRVKQMIL